MKRCLFTLLLSTLLFVPAPLMGATWTAIVEKLAASVVYLETTNGSCTAFVIDENRDYVMTAAHCDGPEMFVDKQPTKMIAKDMKKDLMVLKVEGLDKPALKLAAKNPKTGEQVASFGYGFGLEDPLLRVTYISADSIDLPDIGGPFLATDAGFVGGQSGGPVVNEVGDVLMIVQLSGNGVGLGVGTETIKAKMGKYFEPRKQ